MESVPIVTLLPRPSNTLHSRSQLSLDNSRLTA